MSDSDDDYDPAEVAVPATSLATASSSPCTAATTSGSTAPVSRADLFATSVAPHPAAPTAEASAPSTSVIAGGVTNPNATTPSTATAAEGGYRLRSDIKGRVRCLTLSPSGTTLCAGSEDGQLCMWDFTVPLQSHRAQPTRVLTPFVNRVSGLQPIIALASAIDGSYFVACQDGDSPALVKASGAQLGYCAMGERGLMDVVQCRGHRAPVTCVAPHVEDAASFFTSSQDGTVRLWHQNSFQHRSAYAIKHGSGQVTDTHVVESVASLKGFQNGHGHVFASGGQDGLVQLWDSRVKYRPGGAQACIDLYAKPGDQGAKREESSWFEERHVGGMLEVQAGTKPSPATTHAASRDYGLAVRAGASVKMIDLRQLSADPKLSPLSVAHEGAGGLPFALETTCLAVGRSGPSSLLACTSRAGYQGNVGGHVLQYAYADSSHPLHRTLVWRAGTPEEDVLCVCADRSRADGCLYAGLSSGEVVVHGAYAESNAQPQPMEAWLQTRPEREDQGRRLGEKAPRSYYVGGVEEDVMGDLF